MTSFRQGSLFDLDCFDFLSIKIKTDNLLYSLCLLFVINFYFFIQPFKNYKKYFLFHQKSSFLSWDIQVFLIFPLKLVSTIFCQIYIFYQTIALQKLWIMFSFHPKTSSHSQDIESFLLVSHCFRGRSKTNLKVYDIINCLNKNFYLISWEGKKVWHWNFVHW